MSRSKVTSIVRMDWLQNRTPTGKRSQATKAHELTGPVSGLRSRPPGGTDATTAARSMVRRKTAASHPPGGAGLGQPAGERKAVHPPVHSLSQGCPARAGSLQPGHGCRQRSLFGMARGLFSHDDGHYPHAHALAFGHKEEVRLKSEAFREWWLGVRRALEQERGLAQALRRELQHEQTLRRAREHDLTLGQADPEHSVEPEKSMERSAALVDSLPAEEQQRQQGLGMEL